MITSRTTKWPTKWRPYLKAWLKLEEQIIDLTDSYPLNTDNILITHDLATTYSIKRGIIFYKYNANNAPYSPQRSWQNFFRNKAPNQMKDIVWRLCKNALPLATRTKHFANNTSAICNWCKSNKQTPQHFIQDCELAKTVWTTIAQATNDTQLTILDKTSFASDNKIQTWMKIVGSYIIWTTWNKHSKDSPLNIEAIPGITKHRLKQEILAIQNSKYFPEATLDKILSNLN